MIANKRTLISLSPEDKNWLDRRSAETGVPMTELVRRAVRQMREQEETPFPALLKRTRGLWRAGDGLKYQRRLRREWR